MDMNSSIVVTFRAASAPSGCTGVGGCLALTKLGPLGVTTLQQQCSIRCVSAASLGILAKANSNTLRDVRLLL
jgi:hypothetical protein